ncbi:hypothetical protein ISN45_Aa03g007980 [Arabidopsis thaliana x Arabidopsis arenosa]|uniref:Uncharacterized protein n=1 Tax=Arabidopsis thaliana x Arabidopsis arenosa TaxID=1240361 RepID=A0A8T2ATA0_9BRAS|nr:hypothetical protein ISN45_Aa03g007980 [Arabidopsis thaliana x Arabidopsis arenosa]
MRGRKREGEEPKMKIWGFNSFDGSYSDVSPLEFRHESQNIFQVNGERGSGQRQRWVVPWQERIDKVDQVS